MNKKGTIILKWALLLGIGTSLLQLFKTLTYDLQYFSYGPFVDLLLVLIFIGALYMGIKECRDNLMGGKIKFSQAFGVALGISGITYCIFFAYLILQYTVIDPDGLSKINKRNELKYIERVENDTVSLYELTHYADFVLQQLDSSLREFELDLDCMDDVTNRITVVKNFYPLRLKNINLADSSQMLLKNVDSYAQKILINLTETVSTEKEMLPSCKELLTEVVGNSLQIIRKEYSIVNRRLAESEGKPVVYNNVYAASFSFSFSILIYGLFFGLFVSLYLYKRENKQFVEPNNGEPENQENQE